MTRAPFRVEQTYASRRGGPVRVKWELYSLRLTGWSHRPIGYWHWEATIHYELRPVHGSDQGMLL